MGMGFPPSFSGPLQTIYSRNQSKILPPSGYFGKPNIVLDRTSSTSTINTGTINFAGLFFVDRPIIITKLHGGFAAGVASSVVRCGLYTVDGATRKPLALAVDGGAPVSGAAATPFTITLGQPVVLQPGFYCEALLSKTAGPNMIFRSGLHLPWIVGSGATITTIYRWLTDVGGLDASNMFPNTAPANTASAAISSGWYNYLSLEYSNA